MWMSRNYYQYYYFVSWRVFCVTIRSVQNLLTFIESLSQTLSLSLISKEHTLIIRRGLWVWENNQSLIHTHKPQQPNHNQAQTACVLLVICVASNQPRTHTHPLHKSLPPFPSFFFFTPNSNKVLLLQLLILFLLKFSFSSSLLWSQGKEFPFSKKMSLCHG